MSEQAARVRDLHSGKKAGPFNLQINPTNTCNQNCRFCWQRDDTKLKHLSEMTDAKYMEIIEEAKRLDVRDLTITGGGEPLIRKGLIKKIALATKGSGIHGKIITNGTMMGKDTAKALVDAGWSSVIFSLDSPDPATNDYLRGMKGGYDRTVQGIKILSDAKKEGSSHLPKICVHYVLTNKNYNQIVDMVHLISGLGVENFFIEPLVNLCTTSSIGESLQIRDAKQNEEAIKQMKEAHELCNKRNIENNLHMLKEELISSVNNMKSMIEEKNKNHGKGKSNPLDRICYEPDLNMIIRPNGIVGPCCIFDFKTVSIENKTLAEVWFGPEFENVRKRIKEGSLPDSCAECHPGQVVSNQRIRDELKRENRPSMISKAMHALGLRRHKDD